MAGRSLAASRGRRRRHGVKQHQGKKKKTQQHESVRQQLRASVTRLVAGNGVCQTVALLHGGGGCRRWSPVAKMKWPVVVCPDQNRGGNGNSSGGKGRRGVKGARDGSGDGGGGQWLQQNVCGTPAEPGDSR